MKSQFDCVILGAGAIGSILAAHLACAGRPVAVIARGQRAAHIQNHAPQISGLTEFRVPVHVLTDPRKLNRCAVLIVATKAIGAAEALAALCNARIETALSIQTARQRTTCSVQCSAPRAC